MRIVILLKPLTNASYDAINKHHIQATIYSLLRSTPFDIIHELRGFKYFTFSDIMPPTDFKEGEPKHMLFSSPMSSLVKFLKNRIKEVGRVKIKDIWFEVDVKTVPQKFTTRWITASPIVLYKDSRKNVYFSFYRDTNLQFFLDRLKENALKKYNIYYNDELNFEEPLFDIMKFNKSVSVELTKDKKKFIIIGSTWKLLEKIRVPRHLRKFYRFIFDCGLGEKNSLGFGCLNEHPSLRKHSSRSRKSQA